ncbi:unnamed protein product [Rhizoctonia solani]|uniref:BTB domain-containing protein n=1 Tax=Rhizoctonia solani TaxID=456999 RepID=A0A8H3GFN0_9AGAM|nr:unnamed protein product [Rhizoctonia solani]
MIFLNPHPNEVKNIPETITSQNGTAVYVSKASNAVDSNSPQPAEIPSANLPEPIVHHPEFFFDNTLIAIQIENTLFNVHKYQLAKSDFFSEIFNASKSEGDKPKEGSSPEHPIVIHGAVTSDFTALLRVLYASPFSSNQSTPEASLVVPAFRLAHLLNFSELRTYLLQLAEKNLDDVDKIVFAREFNIKEWLAPAYIRLCEREELLTTEEARKLQVDSVLLIWRMREQNRSRSSTMNAGKYYCSGCIGLSIGYGIGICDHCRDGRRATWYCTGAGIMGSKTDTDHSTLEADVKKWVEDGCAMKG